MSYLRSAIVILYYRGKPIYEYYNLENKFTKNKGIV